MKAYNLRIDPDLVARVDGLGGCRSEHIRAAIRSYLQPSTADGYNRDVLDILRSEVEDLRRDKQYLQGQVNALMVTRMPLLQRVIMRLKGP